MSAHPWCNPTTPAARYVWKSMPIGSYRFRASSTRAMPTTRNADGSLRRLAICQLHDLSTFGGCIRGQDQLQHVHALHDRKAMPGEQRRHPDRDAVDEMQEQVVRVIPGVDELATAARRPGRPPSKRLRRDVERKNVSGPSGVDLAQLAPTNHVAGRRHGAQEELVVSAHQRHA